MIDDYYQLLGIKKDTCECEIKKILRKKLIKLHPNKINIEEEEKQRTEDKLIMEAYNTLLNTHNRKIYDEFGSIKLYQEYLKKQKENNESILKIFLGEN